jgi:uroporphyrinogen III methyltransferase/synthase
MVAAFKNLAIQGQRVLIPRAAQARDILPQELARIGDRVEVVEAYRTVKPALQKEEITALLQKEAIDLITFTSSSTVRNFVEILNSEQEVLKKWQLQGVVACIGPITAQTAREYGLEVQIQPPDYTIEALAQAILDYYRNHNMGA